MKARRDPTVIGTDEFGNPVVGTYIWYLHQRVLQIHEYEKKIKNFFIAVDLKIDCTKYVQVNLFQKHLFLHQLTHNMTKDCSLNYEFTQYMKIVSSEHVENMLFT